MDIPKRKRRPCSRSRNGCLECRSHHRKCDEGRPACGLCRELGRQCGYNKRLTWGGKPFQKSVFGRCMTGENKQTSVVQIHSNLEGQRTFPASSAFVYGLKSTIYPRSLTESPNESYAICTPNIYYSKSLSFLPDLSPSNKFLFNYLTRVADCFSCDENMKQLFCRVYVPMATESPQLLATMLSLAAVHRTNCGLSQNPRELANLQVAAVEQIRSNITSTPIQTLLASVLMLCYTELISGRERSFSWRSHLEGAATIFSHESSCWSVRSQDPSKAFISKCFVSLAALANVSGNPPAESVSMQAIRLMGDRANETYIDDFTAYSTDLCRVFFDIGALASEQRRSLPGHSQFQDDCLQPRTLDLLEWLGSSRQIACEMTTYQEHQLINALYHYAATLQILQQLRGLSPSTLEVQILVRRILDIISGVELKGGPSIVVLLYFPAFTAGCSSTAQTDRDLVRRVLDAMISYLGFRNICQGLDLLNRIWSHQDLNGYAEGTPRWIDFLDSNSDLILY